MLKELWKALGLVKDFEDAKKCYGKRWFTSKTLWVDTIALVVAIVQWKYGLFVPIEAQVGLLAILNMILRFDTNQPLVAKESDIICNPVGKIGEDVVYAPVIQEKDPTGISPKE